MPESNQDVLGTLGVAALVLIAATAVVLAVLVIAMVRRHRRVHRPGVPVSAKVSYWGSIVYALVPLDLLPDPVLVDDIGVLATALVYVGRVLGKVDRRDRLRRGRRTRRGPGGGRGAPVN